MNLIDLTHSPYHHIVLLIVFSTVLGCGTEGDKYPGAPTITVKLKSRSPSKVEYYLESDIVLPYDIKIRARAQGTCTADGKTHNFEGSWFFESDCDDVGYEVEMKEGTIVKHFAACFSREEVAVPEKWLETNVKGTCLVKTLTLVIKPWPGTAPGAYNVGSPSRLTVIR